MTLAQRFWCWWYRVCPECGKYVPFSADMEWRQLELMDWCKHKKQRYEARKERRLGL